MKPTDSRVVPIENRYDLLIIGAGLAGLCLAYRLRQKFPNLVFKVIEEVRQFTDNRTWSFHETDVSDLEVWRPFIEASWDAYQVHFSYERRLTIPYHTISAKKFFSIMQEHLGDHLLMDTKVVLIQGNTLHTSRGDSFYAPCILDSRPVEDLTIERMQDLGWGFQKFLGLEVQLNSDHGLTEPILMDANIPQKDGYRFIYILPISSNILLVEDTYYSQSPNLNMAQTEYDLLEYCRQKSWSVKSIMRREAGCLPIPTTSVLTFDFAGKTISSERPGGLSKIGMAAGFFHPVTGYSFSWAARVAEALSQVSQPTALHMETALEKLKGECLKIEKFYLLLNRLMFEGSLPEMRFKIFERFYQLPKSTIQRFYAGQTNFGDQLRLMIGKPPIPLRSALKVFTQRYSIEFNEKRKDLL